MKFNFDLEKINMYNGGVIHRSMNLSTGKQNVFAEYTKDGVSRHIGANNNQSCGLDEENPSGYKDGIATTEELLNRIEEEGSRLRQEILDTLEYKRLTELKSTMQATIRYFKTEGDEKLKELENKALEKAFKEYIKKEEGEDGN